MANEYATLDELKKARRSNANDNLDDGPLKDRLTEASRAIDRKTGRRFWLDDTATPRSFNPRGRVTLDGRFLVDDIGSTDNLLVEIGAGTSWTEVVDYETSPENALVRGDPITALVRVNGSCYWGAGPQRVRITARWGWPATPEEIRLATLLLANRLYLRKDSPEGVAGSAEWGVIRLSRWDPDVEALIGPFVLPGIA